MTSTSNSGQNSLDELNWKLTKLIESNSDQNRKIDEIYAALFISGPNKDSILETLKKHENELKINKDSYVDHVKNEHGYVRNTFRKMYDTAVSTIVAGAILWFCGIVVLGIDKKIEDKVLKEKSSQIYYDTVYVNGRK